MINKFLSLLVKQSPLNRQLWDLVVVAQLIPIHSYSLKKFYLLKLLLASCHIPPKFSLFFMIKEFVRIRMSGQENLLL